MPESPVSAELVDYVRDLFAPEDDTILALNAAARAFGMPPAWEVSPDVGRLFQMLCRAIGARKVLEFGTLAGHSALWFAGALPADGRVVSIELNPEYAAFAREQLARAGVGAKVEIRLGAALDVLPALDAEIRASGTPFDVIFLDADKAHYPQFLAWSKKALRPGGLLLADNVLQCGSWRGQTLLDPGSDDPRILAIREFNRLLATDPRFTSIIIPMRAGVAAAIFHG
jgi:predicted O-methyltransferase YrrM